MTTFWDNMGGGAFGLPGATFGGGGGPLRAQFRDTVMLRYPNGGLGVPPGATVNLYDVGTTSPIVGTIWADASGTATLPNPMPTGNDGAIDFWLDMERELDVVVSCGGYDTVRVTVTTDSASGGDGQWPMAAGVDSALRTYVQHIMGQIDPTGPPPP